jgi:hypothetical protein
MPGGIDYSRFDNIGTSDSGSDEEPRGSGHAHHSPW